MLESERSTDQVGTPQRANGGDYEGQGDSSGAEGTTPKATGEPQHRDEEQRHTDGGDRPTSANHSIFSPSGLRPGNKWQAGAQPGEETGAKTATGWGDFQGGASANVQGGDVAVDKDGWSERNIVIISQREALLGAQEGGNLERPTQSLNLQGMSMPHVIPNLNRRAHPLSLSNFTEELGSINLSLSVDIEERSEGGGTKRRKEYVPAHLAPMVREWLREQRETNGYLPNSPLRPRPTKKYDGTIGGPSRARRIRFAPYHSVERLIAIPLSQNGNDSHLNPTHETSHT